MDTLSELELEAIRIIREAAAHFRNIALLFSGGKDSTVLLHLARKALSPRPLPFGLLHVDTGHNFPEINDFLQETSRRYRVPLILGSVEDALREGRAVEPGGPVPSRNSLQSIALLDTIARNGFDAIFGGGRRDEEKARAKEKIFSIRTVAGGWDPLRQRAEFWSHLNPALQTGENMRVFPLSNWTEWDVWQYIERESIALCPLYYAHRRRCLLKRNGLLLAALPPLEIEVGDETPELLVRCRTVGDITCTGFIESSAADNRAILAELETLPLSERGLRYDDRGSESSLEDRKRNGYF